jgi:hypothetical protein
MIISVFIGILSMAMVFYRDSIGAHLAGLSLTSAITIMQVKIINLIRNYAMEK